MEQWHTSDCITDIRPCPMSVGIFYLSDRLSSFYKSVNLSFHVSDMVNHFCEARGTWPFVDSSTCSCHTQPAPQLTRHMFQLSRYRTLPHVPNYPNWFWDQAISKLDRERFPNLEQIVDKDGTNTDRYDYNKFLQEGASYMYHSNTFHNLPN